MGAKLAIVVVLVLAAGCSFEPGTLGEPVADEDGAGNAGAPDAPDAGVLAAGCPTTYTITVPGSSSRYRVVDAEATWFAAAAACAVDGTAQLAPHLVVLSNDAERAGLRDFVGEEDAWVGLTNRATAGAAFQWVTTERSAPAPGVTPWERGDPDHDGISCANLRADTGLIGDSDCESERGVICECDQFSNDPTRY